MTEESEVAAPANQLWQMLRGFQVTQALHAAAKLGIFDVLCDGPKATPEIAAAVGAHEPALRRLLRTLTTVDLVTEDQAGWFASTALGETLRSDHPQSVRPEAIMVGDGFIWGPWGDLYQAVRTGKPAFERLYGETFFDYLTRRPDQAAVFDAAMTSGSALALSTLLSAYDFSGFAKIVDVGGGQGALLRGILDRCPAATGVLYDLPSVVAGASELKNSAVAGRCEVLGGDFFESVPAGGDAYILKSIVHDWSDPEAVQILSNCRRAIRENGKILVIEWVVRPSNLPDPAKWTDLMMLVLVTGRERTEDEFRELYAAAGFTLTHVVPTGGGRSIIEGIPA